MIKLHSFYKTWMRIVVVLIALLGVFIGKDFITGIEASLGKGSAADLIIKVLTSSLFFTLLYYGGEYLVRKHLWKVRWFNMDVDFSGKWLGWSFYTHLEIPSAEITHDTFDGQKFTSHTAIIEQDCLEAKIVSSVGAGFASWKSIALNISENKALKFAYEVTYQGETGFPSRALGYEELEPVAVKNHEGVLPVLLSGTFYHCATGNKPIYRGHTIFVRESHRKLISPEDLPGFAKAIFKEITGN